MPPIIEEEKEVEGVAHNSNNISKNNLNNVDTTANIDNNSSNVNSNNINTSVIEMNYDDFLAVAYPLLPKNKQTFLKVLKKLCLVDKKIEKLINNKNKRRRNNSTNKEPNTTEAVNLFIKLLPEFSNQVIQIANDMKNSSNKESKDSKENYIENLDNNLSSNNFNNLNTPKKVIKDITSSNNNIPIAHKESARKAIENQISKITKHFNSNKIDIINSMIKQIWNLTIEMEKEIDKNINIISNTNNINNTFNLTQKYLVDLDTILISFSNLINCYPSMLCIILKFHKNVKKDKDLNIVTNNNIPQNKVSFISFLIRRVFYVLNFYRNCQVQENNKEPFDTLVKDKDDVLRKLGYEANSYQAALEAFRNHNIICFFMHAMCYKRRNMSSSDVFLINKCRKKIFKEIDLVFREIVANTAKFEFSTKNIILYKSSLFCIYSLTEFHDNSHVYLQTNPFEISKLLISNKENSNDILKNIVQIMKQFSLSNPFTFSLHKLTTLFLSDFIKFIRVNPKIKLGTILSKDDLDFNSSKGKLLLKTLQSGGGDIIIEADLGEFLNEDANVEDIIMQNVENDNDNAEEDNEEGDEFDQGEDEEDELDADADDDNEDEEDEGSDQAFFYSISSSANDEGDEEDDEEDDDDEDDDEDDEDDQSNDDDEPSNDEINNHGLRPIDHQGIIINDVNMDDNEEDNEDYVDDENEEEASEPDEEYIINDDHLNNEASVQFNDDNEYMNIDREETITNSEYDSEGNYVYNDNVNYRNIRENALIYGYSNHRASNGHIMSFRMGGNIPSILINNNDAANAGFFGNDAGDNQNNDDVLFFNQGLEKTAKAENSIYFDETVTFPYMVFLVNDEMFEFYRPGIYISIINKLKRKHIETLNSVFQFRYISPFDKKARRNLYFALVLQKKRLLLLILRSLLKWSLIS